MESRDAAIRYYLHLFANPLHAIPHNRSQILMRHIIVYCDIYDTDVFTLRDVGRCAGTQFTMNVMRKLASLTDAVTEIGHGDAQDEQDVEWAFRKNLLQ